jgi:iron complex transport system substrate-binding protein
VTQALCDVCAVAEAEVKSAACTLSSLPGVVNLEPETLDEVFGAIRAVAKVTNRVNEGEAAVARLRERVERVTSRTKGLSRPRVALLEWLDPPFSTGHWNPELVRLAGGEDGLGQEGKKSVTLKWEQVIAYQPEVVLISCCGFTIERSLQEVGVLSKVEGWEDLPAVRDGRVWVSDGSSYFSRPSQRLVDSLELLAHVIHPDVFTLPAWVTPPVRLESHAHSRV